MDHMQYMRSAYITVTVPGTLREKLSQIPGYNVARASNIDSRCSTSLYSPEGIEIRLEGDLSSIQTKTLNVLGQDSHDQGHIPPSKDALVKLKRAAEGIDDLSVEVTMSDKDMR